VSILAAIIGTAFAAPEAAPTLDVWVRAPAAAEHALMREIGLGFVEGQQGEWWHMNGEASAEASLKRSGLSFHRAASQLGPAEAYLSPSEMVEALNDLADTHPDAAEIVDIGSSVEGRPITALRLGRSESPVHKMRILGAHHGDETSSAEVALQAAVDLLEDASVTGLLDTHEVWVVPHTNPDGVDSRSRYNSNNVDLNRNYGFEWSPTAFRPGDYPFSEPETRAVRALNSWVDFGLGLSIHSGATNIGWVWNYTTDTTPDEGLLEHMGEAYAEECTTDGFWITNGAAWYTTTGDTTDWSYGRHGTLDFTVEVSTSKSPGPAQMSRTIDEHAVAVATILDWPWWVSGVVSDATSGLGVPATIEIEETSRRIVTGPDGSFSRPMEDGVWTLTVSAPGYETSTLASDVAGLAEEISLFPTAVSSNQPVSRWLSSDGMFSLTNSADSVELSREGSATVTATEDSGGWSVDPEDLQPGPYSLIIDGLAVPRGLFVPERTPTARIDGVSVDDSIISVDLSGLGRGTRAWALWGSWRNPVAVPVISEADSTLVLDGALLPLESTPVDLVILTSGMQLGVANVLGDTPDDGPEDSPPEEDNPADTGDSSLSDSDDEDIPAEDGRTITSGASKLSPGGCQVSPGRYPGTIWLVSLLALALGRRKLCEHTGNS